MNAGTTLITGATGFLGARLLASLLDSGMSCTALARGSKTPAGERVQTALGALGRTSSGLKVIPCDLRNHQPGHSGGFSRILHVAASTRFDLDACQEPIATNVNGTRNLLDFATAHNIQEFHLVSTAYVSSGQPTAMEAPANNATPPRNAYERSKRDAEQLALDWAAADIRRSLTIYRPSIIVGEFNSGRSEKFDGFYVAIRALELLSRRRSRQSAGPIRLEGGDAVKQNIVPIDWVTDMITAIVASPARHGRIYHLTNPHSPANSLIRQVVQEQFGLGQLFFVDKIHGATDAERLFSDAASTIRPYMAESPTFDRTNTREIEKLTGRSCPAYDAGALSRLISFATATRFGQLPPPALSSDDQTHCATFFEHFLPERITRSGVAIAAAMTVVVRFAIGADHWTCRFIHGRLANVRRNPDPAEDFSYTLSAPSFFEVLSGSRPPQELFFKGEATITGDVERALKMVMIFDAFVREFPCTRQSLAELKVAS